MKTLCQHCIFAEKEHGIQVGCSANLLKNFEYEFVDNHYILNGYCDGIRNVYWKHYADLLPHEININDLIRVMNKEREIEYDCIIPYYVPDVESKLHDCIGSLLNLSVAPQKIMVSTNLPVALSMDLYKELFGKFGNKIQVNVDHTFLSVDSDGNGFVEFLRTVKRKLKSTYWMFVEHDTVISEEVIKEINDMKLDQKPPILYASDKYVMCLSILINSLEKSPAFLKQLCKEKNNGSQYVWNMQ